MEYSPINSIQIRNFRQLGSVDLNFDTPIITLVGENDAGKTSTILAIAVCGLNAHSSKQKKYIKRGTNAFGVGISLFDGTEIQRIKSSTQNSLQIKRGNEVLLNLTKIDNPSIQPVELEKVMGLLKDTSTGEILNIRTYNDRLMFAQTTGGDNYKIVYELLKVSNLVQAIKRGNEETSGYKKKINNNAILIEHTLNSLRNIKLINIQPLIITKNNLIQKSSTLIKLSKAVRVTNQIKGINQSNIGQLQSLNEINISLFDKLSRALIASRITLNKSQSIEELSRQEEIDTGIIIKIKKAIKDIKAIKQDNTIVPKEIDSLSVISEAVLNKLTKAKQTVIRIRKGSLMGADIVKDSTPIDQNQYNKIERAVTLSKVIKNIDDTISTKQQEILEISNSIKESGIKYKICNNCGEVVIIE